MTIRTREPQTRRLADQDLERWLELWDGYLAFYRVELEPALTRFTFERLRDGADGMLGLIATDVEDHGLGFAHLLFHPSTWSSSGYCYLEDLYVDRSARGMGVGRALIEATYTEARSRDADRVYWHTQQFNGAARSLYETVARLTSYVVYEHELAS